MKSSKTKKVRITIEEVDNGYQLRVTHYTLDPGYGWQPDDPVETVIVDADVLTIPEMIKSILIGDEDESSATNKKTCVC